jgi:hypothetical protein
MGCTGLLEVPWSFKDESLVREVLEGAPNQFDNSLRCETSWWTEEKWRVVYNFRKGGFGMAFRKDDFVRGKFAHNVNPKDGYAISDCSVEREKRVLEFVVSIFYPEKPNRVTVTLGNTIFGSLSSERPVDWAKIIRDIVSKLAGAVGRTKGSSISPFLFHLYKHEGLLKSTEEITWKTQEALLKYGESGSESDLGAHSESESKSDKELSIEVPAPNSWAKTTPKDGRSKFSGSTSRILKEDPFRILIDNLEEVRDRYFTQEEIVHKISRLVGVLDLGKLAEAVANSIADPIETQRLQDECEQLWKEHDRLRKEDEKSRKEVGAMTTELQRMEVEVVSSQNQLRDARGLDPECVRSFRRHPQQGSAV